MNRADSGSRRAGRFYGLLIVTGLICLCWAVSIAAQIKADSPASVVVRYYQAISSKDVAALQALYPEPADRGSGEPHRQMLETVRSASVYRWLGVQQEGSLAHVQISLRVVMEGEAAPQYHFAQHDLARKPDGWRLIAADLLPPERQAALIRLWQRQQRVLEQDPAVRRHADWVKAQSAAALARYRQREPEPVSEQ